MDSKLYVSSLAFLGKPVEEMIQICAENQFNLEFSSGIPFHQDMEEIYLRANIQKMLHNYFPAPKIPFVLNLASKNEKIREMSIDHCKNGLSLSRESNSPFFAAHAGFCIDPNPAELGRKLSFDPDFDRELHKTLFEDSVKKILAYADSIQVDFLVENNVLASFNFDGVNPLLCTDSSGINEFFEKVNHPRLGFLLDTAHLKVSCQTLNLDLDEELQLVKKHIKGIHHSDNEGEVDNNQPIGQDYWFLKYGDQFDSTVQVLEVKNQTVREIKYQLDLLGNLGS